MVAVIVVVIVVVKVMVLSTLIIDTVVAVDVLVIDVLADTEIIVPSGVTVDLFMDSLAGVMLVGLAGIGIVVLTDVNSRAWAVVMTILEFPVPTPLEEFSR